ncbi:MAG: DUF2341 domain-containing protein [Bacilli bacterium]
MVRLPLHRWRYSARLLFSGCDRATYQQDLVVHRTAGRDYEETLAWGVKVWHIFIGPKCRPDYGDLRFTDGNTRGLAYYLWPDFTSESARFAVRLEGATSAGQMQVWYGNPSATTTSDEDATYLFFDHFKGTSLDTTKWYKVGTPTVSDSNVTVNSSNEEIKSRQVFGAGTILEGRGSLWNANYHIFGLGQHPYSPFIIYQYGHPAAGNYNARASSSTALGSGWTGVHTWAIHRVTSGSAKFYIDGSLVATVTTLTEDMPILLQQHATATGSSVFDYVLVRPVSATPPALLRTSREMNLSYAGLARLLPGGGVTDDVIRFAGVGDIQVPGDERYAVSGAGAFTIETLVRSPITIAGTAGMMAGINLAPVLAALAGLGGIAFDPARMHTQLDVETGVGTPYVAPTPVQFDVWQYRFESFDVSRSAQDALWRCNGQIDGLQAPLAYKSFTVRVPDHNGVLRTIFFGFVPGRDYVQAVAADKSTMQGFDAGFYLTRQYLPNGNLYYPARFLWTPMNLIKYWLGEEIPRAGCPSYWERTTGIMPYRIHDPISYGHPYTPKDWNFQPLTTKVQAIQEVCEYSGMVFLVKWRFVNGAMTPCAYLVHQDDIDHATHGLDLPPMVTFTHPDPHIANGVRATLQSDEKYNRIEVRSASPSGAWFHAVRETAALQAGDELPIEYLEERSDLPIDADHGGWCSARADELYAYYTAYSYTYTMTLINRTDMELYQRCRFYGFGTIPDGDVMRIVSIRYHVLRTHTEVEITVTPDSRLSDLRRLQRSQAADSVSEVQTIVRGQINQLAAGEVGTVVSIDGVEAIVELERRADSSVRGRIV